MPNSRPPQGKKPQPPPLLDSEDRTTPGGPPPGMLEEVTNTDAPVMPGPGDATLVYKNKRRARLLVQAGPARGTEFALGEARVTIGRGTDNAFVIADISVSRSHVAIEREGDGWVAVDLKSGNGTTVNGKAIDRHLLRNHDEIAMGDTSVQFVDPNAPEVTAVKGPRPAAPRGKRRFFFSGLFLGGLAAAAAAALLLSRGKSREETARAELQETLDESSALLKQGKLAEARETLKTAGTAPEARRALEALEAEAPRAEALQAAREALAKQQYEAARNAIERVPDDSALIGAAREVQLALSAALDQAVADARKKIEAGDTAGARELLNAVTAAAPLRSDALELKQSLEGQRHAARAEAPAAEPETASAPETPRAAPSAPDHSIDTYLSGDLPAALAEAEGAHRGKLASQIRQFEAALKEGRKGQQAGHATEAIRSFDTAAALDRAIAQGQDSRLGSEVQKALSALHYALGNAPAGDDALPAAAAHLRAAVAADPSNDAAQKTLESVNARAREIYLRGYAAKDGDPETAVQAFKLVVDTLPADDATSQKARFWLTKLEKKH